MPLTVDRPAIPQTVHALILGGIMGIRTTFQRIGAITALAALPLTVGATMASAAELSPGSVTAATTTTVPVTESPVSALAPTTYKDHGECTRANGGLDWPINAVWPEHTHYYPWGRVMYESMVTYRVNPDIGGCKQHWQRWW